MNRFYITTAIPYVNSDPHLGHALGFIQADVIARYHRAKGTETFLHAGSDENSLKNVQAAEKVGIPVTQFVATYAERFRTLLKVLNISNDDFIRTTEERHVRGAQKLWEACDKSGDVYKKKYRGLYCVGCEAFYTEKELEDGFCPEHKTKPEIVEEENYFFRLSKYQDELEKLITSGELRIIPETRRNEVLAFIKGGLEDLSISRSTARAKGWGIPVPGDPTQIQYVWFDALSNYINAVGYGYDEKQFAKWWQDNPHILHVIGKGISRFHAVYWPAMLWSAGLRLPSDLLVHGYLTIEGEKISKSLGNVVDPIKLVEQYGTDAVRYFLLRGISSYDDGDFSESRFKELYNADLANGIGNFVQRVTTLAEKVGLSNEDLDDSVFKDLVEQVKGKIKVALEKYEFHEAIGAVQLLVGAGDKYVNETKVWGKEGSEQKKILGNLASLALNIANLLQIFLPETAEEILKRFGLTLVEVRSVKGGTLSVKKGEALFKRL